MGSYNMLYKIVSRSSFG